VTMLPSMTKTGFPGKLVQGVRTMGNGNPAGSSNGAGRVGSGASGSRNGSEGTAALGGCTTQGRTKSLAMADADISRRIVKGRIPGYAAKWASLSATILIIRQ
jgi:hypothetical protein